MKIIGITGYVGSGKTLACELIEKNFDTYIINTDNIAKEIITNINEFSWLKNKQGSILSDNELDIVKEKIHPLVWEKVEKVLENGKNNGTFDNIKYVLVETALPSSDFFNLCDVTILLKNEHDMKTKLLKEKRKYNNNIINAIIKTQKFYETFYDKCKFIILNDDDKLSLENKLIDLLNNKIGL